jgi:hypothetical protein
MQNNNSAHDEQNLESSAYPTNPLLPEGVQRQNPYFLNEQSEQSSARTIHEGPSLLEQMGIPSESEDPWSREYVHHFQPLLPEGVQPKTPYFLNEQNEQPSARTIHERTRRDAAISQHEVDQAFRRSFEALAPTNATHSGFPFDLEPDNLMLDHSHPFSSIQTPLSEIISGNDDESSFAGLAPIRDPIEPSPTAKLLSAAPEEINDQLPSNLRPSSAHASITPFPSGELGQPHGKSYTKDPTIREYLVPLAWKIVLTSSQRQTPVIIQRHAIAVQIRVRVISSTMTPTVWSQMAGHPRYPGKTNTCWRPSSLVRYSTAPAQRLANSLSNEGRLSRTCCTVSLP